jgi:glutaredoxin
MGLLAAPVLAQSRPQPSEADADALVVFVREGCPHCAEAKRFLAKLAADRSSLRIVCNRSTGSRGFEDLADLQGRGCLAALACRPVGGQALVRFDDAERSGPALVAFIDEAAPPAPVHEVQTALFGPLSASRLGLPLFTVALGLLDGFNPCAMWVLLFLLSLLVRLQDRRRMALIAGTFVVTSGAVYYAFMAAWLNVFLAVGMTTALRWTLGGAALVIGAFNVKDFFALGRASLSILQTVKLTSTRRPGESSGADHWRARGDRRLALLVNVVEPRAPPGFRPLHPRSRLSRAVFLATLCILGSSTTPFTCRRRSHGRHRRRHLSRQAAGGGRGNLKLLSGLVMLGLGLLLLAKPGWLG